MKVLWVHSGGWKSHAAISYIGVHNAWSFAEIGLETHLVMPDTGNPSDTGRDLEEFYGLSPHPQLHVHRLNPPRRAWQLRHPYFGEAAVLARQLRREMAPAEPLLLLSREQRFLPTMAALARDPQVVALFEAHYGYVDQRWRDGSISFGDRKRGWLERYYLPRIGGLIALLEPQLELYRRAIPGLHGIALPLGAKHLAHTTAGREEEYRQRRTLAYIGHLHGYKGIDALVGFAGRLAQHDIRALFVGGNEDEVARYRSQCATAGLTNLEWIPFAAPARMFATLAEKASVGIVALEDTFYNRNLTCPVKALDFLSLGIPVVAADLPSTRGVLADSGRYFAPRNLESMLVEVLQIMDDPEHYRQQAVLSRQRAAEIDWPGRARRIAAFAAERLAEAARR